MNLNGQGWIYFILLAFPSIGAIQGTHDNVDSVTVPSVKTTTVFTMPTFSPSEKLNFTLKLSNSGPACLDSQIIFNASLLDHQGRTVQSKFFHYQWFNNANQSYEVSKGQYQAAIIKTFESDSVVAGQYLMSVAVYGDQDSKKKVIAHSSTTFILTESLNGDLQVNQSLPFQRNKTVFATDHPIVLKLNMKDKFDKKRYRFNFVWYKNNKLMKATSKPECTFQIPEKGSYKIEANAFAYSNVKTMDRINYPEVLSDLLLVVNRCKQPNSSADKCKRFTQNITTIERLTVLDIEGGTSVAVKDVIKLNVSCLGSSPTGVCWNATALNRTHMNDNVTCTPTVFSNTSCFHQILVRPKQRGWHDVGIAVYNDISYMHGNYFVYAYDSDSSGSSVVTIPLVFSLLAAVIVIIGGVYLWKLKKKPYIEVADFEFHPSIERNGSYVVFANFLVRVKQFLKRSPIKRLSVQSENSFQQTSQNSNSGQALYDSL
ncbi:uncharacterized protein LOC126810520 [Patella vulgata]|uniref:uncharacterized protein LOC126810520 n=1 Tax=Patella vulgata TaxID=6465 RepID=UPI00217F62A3|nr:uncharacterized protein LOC126810520 [Patella vulgata]